MVLSGPTPEFPKSVEADRSRPSPFAGADLRLSPGDLAPDWTLKTPDGEAFSFRNDAVAGHTLVIFVAGESARAIERVEQFRQKAMPIAALGALAYLVVPSMDAAERSSWDPAHALVDAEGHVAASLKASSSDQAAILVLRANYHVAALFTADEESAAIQALCRCLQSERHTSVGGSHPPVLLVPDVFSKEECRQLIQVFEERPDGQVKFPHPWPPQIPPGRTVGL